MDSASVLDLLAAGYRLDLDDSAYLRQVVDAAVPLLDRGLGVFVYTYDATDPDMPVIRNVAMSERFDPAWLPPFYAAVNAQTEEIGRADYPTGFRAWGHMTCGQASAVPGMRLILPLFAHLGGARDSFALNALDASGQGLWVGAPLASTARVPASQVALFSRVAAHLTAAVRLRRTSTTAAPKPVAALSPRGKLLHAERDESIESARELLRDATVDFDRARSKRMRGDPDGATRRWRPLVSSRWSLLDDFDGDGRRFVVAVENRPPTRALTTELSEREHQVLTHAHLGHTNKEIAYELGLAASTVRVLLHRAAAKLGVTTRAALLRRFEAMTKPPSDRR